MFGVLADSILTSMSVLVGGVGGATLFGTLGAGWVTVAGVLIPCMITAASAVYGYGKLNQKVNDQGKSIEKVYSSITLMGTRIDAIIDRNAYNDNKE